MMMMMIPITITIIAALMIDAVINAIINATAATSARECLHEAHEILRLRVDHFGRVRVDDHRPSPPPPITIIPCTISIIAAAPIHLLF
jgi:hypothetical protein